jgi:hypothetical protein
MSALILVQSAPVPLILIVVLPTVAPMMLTVASGTAALVGLPATVAFAVPVGVAVIVAGVRGDPMRHPQSRFAHVAQEGPPSLRRRPAASDHVLGHRRLGDFKAELQQFAMNPRGAP